METQLAYMEWQGSEDAQRRAAVFQPAFERLVALMSGRVRYPEDWDSWEEDDRDDFKHARQDVAETLVDAAGDPLCAFMPQFVLQDKLWTA